jgi:nucleotide-binding universal stress UspA family protein
MKVLISISTDESAEIVLHEAQVFLSTFPDVDVHIFTVVDMAMISVGRDDLDDMRMMDSLEHQADKFNANLAHIMGDTKYTFSSEIGYPSDEILKKIESSPYDLLILGTHAHSAFDHLLNTSVVEKILRSAACKTLVIPIKKDRSI